jgi:fumarate reductase flavoprotein subunit
VTVQEFDLISVGGGYAGLTAASRAAQLGLKAAVLERGSEERYACNSRYAGGVMHVSYHDPKSSHEVLTAAINDISAGYADADLVNAIANHAGRSVEWLRNEGARFARAGNVGWRQWILAPLRPAVTQMDWQGRGADVALRALEKNLVERGGTVYRDTQVFDLIIKNEICAGVMAKRGGTDVAFGARAVVLADGGFQGNTDMAGQYLAPKPHSLKQRGAGTGFGDGIRMARAAQTSVRWTRSTAMCCRATPCTMIAYGRIRNSMNWRRRVCWSINQGGASATKAWAACILPT